MQQSNELTIHNQSRAVFYPGFLRFENDYATKKQNRHTAAITKDGGLALALSGKFDQRGQIHPVIFENGVGEWTLQCIHGRWYLVIRDFRDGHPDGTQASQNDHFIACMLSLTRTVSHTAAPRLLDAVEMANLRSRSTLLRK